MKVKMEVDNDEYLYFKTTKIELIGYGSFAFCFYDEIEIKALSNILGFEFLENTHKKYIFYELITICRVDTRVIGYKENGDFDIISIVDWYYDYQVI